MRCVVTSRCTIGKTCREVRGVHWVLVACYRRHARGVPLSNARIRQFLESQPAPVIAFLIENKWVNDDCGILDSRYRNIGEGVMVARRAVTPTLEVAREQRAHIARLRERL